MKASVKKGTRLSAIGVASALAMGGAFVLPAAAAEGDNGSDLSAEALAAQTAETLVVDPEVQIISPKEDGSVSVYVDATKEEIEAQKKVSAETYDYLDEHDRVAAVPAPGLEFDAYAQEDVVGGAGTAAPGESTPEGTPYALCSIAFPAWSPSGDPAAISAGHCTDDGALSDVARSLPSADEANGSEQFEPWDALGTYGFSQYGGPGNSAGDPDAPEKSSTDISVIDITNEALNTVPAVTDWTTADSDDLAASSTPITSVGSAAVGDTVSKSGRTTGLTSGEVFEANSWANIGGRLVYGFGTFLTSDHGDSGGAVFRGETAVGILSGGAEFQGQPFMWAADLQNALSYTDGYTVQLDIAEPVVTSPEDGTVEQGAEISGTAPANSTLVVTLDGVETEVAVDGDGNWSFPAPEELGSYEYTLRAEQGYNVSEDVSYSVQVVLAKPVISSPEDGSKSTEDVTEIAGTGIAGATVTLAGDVEGTAEVGEDGNWTVPADLSYGEYTVEATQALEEGEPSAAASSTFQVVPTAPTILSPEDGSVYDEGQAPTTITGEGIDGATVTVSVNGVEAQAEVVPAEGQSASIAGEKQVVIGDVPVEAGVWSIELDEQLAAGAYEIVATQSIDDVSSAEATAAVEVNAVTAPDDPDDELPATGMDDGAMFGTTMLGVGLLVAAGATMTIARMRRTAKAQL